MTNDDEYPEITHCLKQLADVQPPPEATRQAIERTNKALLGEERDARNQARAFLRFRITKAVLQMNPTWRAVAAAVLAALLVASGWAADRIYQGLVEGRRIDMATRFLPGPQPGEWLGVRGPDTSSPDWRREEVEQEQVHKLIDQGKYQFVRTVDTERGYRFFLYRFALPNGRKVDFPLPMSLDGIKSWREWEQKRKEQGDRQFQAFRSALKNGKLRVVNIVIEPMHICRHAETGKILNVEQVTPVDGPLMALATEDGTAGPLYETTWEEHLALVRQGKRELLGVKALEYYVYEFTLPDGTKATESSAEDIRKRSKEIP
jgi:hypothetical protein